MGSAWRQTLDKIRSQLLYRSLRFSRQWELRLQASGMYRRFIFFVAMYIPIFGYTWCLLLQSWYFSLKWRTPCSPKRWYPCGNTQPHIREDFHLDVHFVHIGTSIKAFKDKEAVSFTNLVIWYNYWGSDACYRRYVGRTCSTPEYNTRCWMGFKLMTTMFERPNVEKATVNGYEVLGKRLK